MDIELELPINIEFIAVKINLNRRRIFLTCSYIPPNSDQEIYLEHSKAIKSICQLLNPDDLIFVFGDFNLPFVTWNFLSDSHCYFPINTNNFIDEFLNNLSDACLFQVNGIKNDYNRLLDLVFVNEPADCTITRHRPISSPEDHYHPTIELTCNFQFKINEKVNKTKVKEYCFKKTDYDNLNFLLTNTNWMHTLSMPDESPETIDGILNIFYTILKNYLEQCVPKHFCSSPSGPPWTSKNLSRLKNQKNKYYKKYRTTSSSNDYIKYCTLRAQYNLLNMRLYKNYINNIKCNLKRDPKSFYEFVNKKRKSNTYPPVMKSNGIESSDLSVISNMFADFFSSTYSDAKYDSSHEYPYFIQEQQPIMFPYVNTTSVTYFLKKLKFSTSVGPDGIPNCILINCAENLSYPLTILFNMSIKYGYFPNVWKKSFIIPLFKSGCKSSINNYRGIAKLSSIPKLFEQCICETLCHQISSLLSPSQHGFRKGRSTSTNLLELTTKINNSFTIGKSTNVIYTDFSKAFDRVNHHLLIEKLYIMGFTNNTLNWIKTYLQGRHQCVYFNNFLSKKIHVKSGVPQGSHLGPILFLLYINDLPSSIKFSNVLIYADDVKIFSDSDDLFNQSYLQLDLDSFFKWCNCNLLDLNLKKCKHMHFSRRSISSTSFTLGGCLLECVDEFLDLGVLFDRKLLFNSHIDTCINKARGVWAFIKRWAKEFNDQIVTKQLYTSLVRPILEYCSVIWDPYYNIHSDRIESVQKQFLLFILRNTYPNFLNLPSYESRLQQIKLPTLKSRRKVLNVIFLIKIMNGDIGSEFLVNEISFNIPQRSLRNFHPLALQYYRQNYANADPFRRICNNFNELYNVIDMSCNVNVIKRNLILYLNN